MRKLLYFSPAGSGGLADYGRQQANALGRLGVRVDFQAPTDFVVQRGEGFSRLPPLPPACRCRGRLANRLAKGCEILSYRRKLAKTIEIGHYTHVLAGAYAEYLAPLWAARFRRLRGQGVKFGAVVHDPIRDFAIGPSWWHRRSIADAYSFLSEAFVHEALRLNTVRPMPQLHTTVIPHGPMPFPPAKRLPAAMRTELGIPISAKVWLSFGHVRNGKNLHHAIRALGEFPQAFLLVAGKEQSSGQKPVAFYQELAAECGVAERCRWLNHFIPESEVGDLFAAADVVLLTYNKDFRSASGVLNTAVWFRKPCLASSGPSNLKTAVERYALGVWVEPDSTEALVAGLRRWETGLSRPKWEQYAADNSWERNAQLVIERMFGESV